MSLYARPAQDDTMAEINVTPFTDVLLVLMIIFILLAAIALPPGFQKSLANTCDRCAHPTPKHPSIEVAVTPNGRIFVGNQLVNESTVYGALAAIARHDITTTVDLTGDTHAPYGLIVRTLDAAKAAGLENVTFVAQ